MVRLKGEYRVPLRVSFTFQFHNGSIKRRHLNLVIALPFLRFNSTMVRLKALSCRYTKHANPSFNSTMVRLKVTPTWRRRWHLFKVSIPTMVRLKGGASPMTSISSLKFQFHNGSIKSLSLHTWQRVYSSVSIPQWFD